MGEPWSELDYSFQDRMEAGKLAARASIERSAYLGARVTHKRPKLKRLLSVAEVAKLWGCSQARVRFLCDAGRIVGAYRRRKGKGRGYAIPAPPTLTPGSRGPAPKTANVSGLERARPDTPPF
jgi:hypothetical protein